jgi:hypothetical protein
LQVVVRLRVAGDGAEPGRYKDGLLRLPDPVEHLFDLIPVNHAALDQGRSQGVDVRLVIADDAIGEGEGTV